MKIKATRCHQPLKKNSRLALSIPGGSVTKVVDVVVWTVGSAKSGVSLQSSGIEFKMILSTAA